MGAQTDKILGRAKQVRSTRGPRRHHRQQEDEAQRAAPRGQRRAQGQVRLNRRQDAERTWGPEGDGRSQMNDGRSQE